MAQVPSAPGQHDAAPLGPPAVSLENIQFDNRTLRELAVEDSRANTSSRASIRGVNFSLVDPLPVENPKLVAASLPALELLGLGPEQVERPEFVEYFSGNRPLPGAQPAAHNYCGHQFGFFSGQLGDGAAMYLGEAVHPVTGQRWELQFKGAGPTPYSRAADGRKVLRSSVREFLCSEAMHALGVPTTRAATCVTSDTLIVRDPQYDGNAIREKCTVITRLAPTFLRFGSFEIFKPTDSTTGRTGPSSGLEAGLLPRLLHFTIRHYFPDIWTRHGGATLLTEFPEGREAAWQPMYADWLTEVAVRTASLVAAWQSVGWCHGVLNTDNMSILGITIDYGPFGFLDDYNPGHVCNGSDDGGRYTYEAQPSICRWNIEKLGEAVRWAVPAQATADALHAYDVEFDRAYIGIMRRKLGLIKSRTADDVADLALVTDLLDVMNEAGSDWTNTWRALSRLPLPTPGSSGDAAPSGQEYEQLLSYLLAQGSPPEVMSRTRDTTIPHSNLAMLQMLATKDPATLQALGATPQQIAAEAAKAKAAAKWRKMTPEEKNDIDTQAWTRWLARYSKRLAEEVAAGLTQPERVAVMNSTNPRYVLRNWMAHEAIQAAEKGDFAGVRELLQVLQDPFTTLGEDDAYRATATGADSAAAPPSRTGQAAGVAPGDDYEATHPEQNAADAAAACTAPRKYDRKPPAWATKLCVTCSS